MTDDPQHRWVQAAKAHGWADVARSGLDAFAPLAPLGAQLVWIAQPVLGLFLRRDRLAALAQALETPEGLQDLRGQLEDDLPTESRPAP